jgi:hypothetical protein
MIRRRAIDDLRIQEGSGRTLALTKTPRTDIVVCGQPPSKAPNFLARVRNFAAGE